MKTNRFFALFLALVLSLCLFPAAYAAGDEKPELPADPDILAKAALLVDANTGTVVYAKGEHGYLNGTPSTDEWLGRLYGWLRLLNFLN